MGAENLPAIRVIIQAAPRGRQLVFASATQEPKAAAAIATLAPDLVLLQTCSASVNENIEHLYLVCEQRDKPELLRKLFHALNPERAMVFAHRNETAERVAAKLAHHKIPAADLNAALEKQDRKQAMEDFRSARVRVLITSDVAARGLDIKGVTHIFNLDVPTQSKAYLHRVGRTARAGAKGLAVTLVTADEVRLIRRYESELGIVVRHVDIREGRLVVAYDRESRG